jgi:hypothetical protein
MHLTPPSRLLPERLTVLLLSKKFPAFYGTRRLITAFLSLINPVHISPSHSGYVCSFVRFWRDSPQKTRASSFTRFLDHTQRRTTVCRTPLNEWSARRRDLFLTTNNTRNRQTSMPSVGFEPTNSAGERPLWAALYINQMWRLWGIEP